MTFRACFFKGTRKGLIGQFERFTRWWTKSKYSHVELQFSDGMSASSVGKDCGVRLKYIDYNSEQDQWDFITIPDELEAEARAWFELHKGDAYNYNAIFGFFLGFIPTAKHNEMCAESCMDSLGFKDSYRFSPAAMYSVLERMFTPK